MSIGLSSIALCWMLNRARQCGVGIRPDRLRHYEALRDPAAAISKNFDPLADPKRVLAQADLVHESVSPRGDAGGKPHNDPPPGLPVARDLV